MLSLHEAEAEAEAAADDDGSSKSSSRSRAEGGGGESNSLLEDSIESDDPLSTLPLVLLKTGLLIFFILLCLYL